MRKQTTTFAPVIIIKEIKINMAQELKHFFTHINHTMQNYWDLPGFSDFGENVNYTFGQIATQVARLHVLYEACGVKQGDKIAFCGVNSSNWGISFLSTMAYGAVGVSILSDFTGADIEKLVNHSEAKFLLVGPIVATKINPANMPNVRAIIAIKDFTLFSAQQSKYQKAFDQWDELFAKKYPNGFTKNDVHYKDDNIDDLALINYTSGTTSDPKGVMLSYRSLSSNCQYGLDNLPGGPGKAIVSILPLAHMFGMMFEFIYQVAGGTHVYFIPKLTVPTLLKALKECHPYQILTVPLLIEKIYKAKLQATVNKPIIKFLWNFPGIGRLIKNKVRDGLLAAFGGQLRTLIIGGAALNPEVEKCLMDVKFPLLVGYGMTETGPLLGYVPWQEFVPRSCGRCVDRMQIRIDSDDQQHIVGEIQVKGDNVMIGYYKNEEATKNIFTPDGWLRTGDLGIVDANGNIFIRGRSKNMLLGPSGQNIYPEEIEAKVNSLPYVIESVVISRDDKIVALVFPDHEAFVKSGETRTMEQLMEENRQLVNHDLPTYSAISRIILVDHEFEKTPKRSIKRFLYT